MPAKGRPSGGEELGERIRKYRLERGLTQAQLGKKVGVSQRVVAYYEVKGISPPPALLVKLADALRVSADVLLRGSKRKNRPEPEPTIDVRRGRHLKKLAGLPAYDQKAIFRIIEALADRQQKRRSG